MTENWHLPFSKIEYLTENWLFFIQKSNFWLKIDIFPFKKSNIWLKIDFFHSKIELQTKNWHFAIKKSTFRLKIDIFQLKKSNFRLKIELSTETSRCNFIVFGFSLLLLYSKWCNPSSQWPNELDLLYRWLGALTSRDRPPISVHLTFFSISIHFRQSPCSHSKHHFYHFHHWIELNWIELN